ncbi:MAG: TIGR01212 family radical SAM protein [Candidatus Aminicenantes bacterium]|nr:MAG: TIGR01212 family radical SAM protein [Candidatus Aminicenantes bacterium]
MQKPYNSFNSFLKKKFNQETRKIPINAGFTCPNKDGRISSRGCIFCDTYGSGPIKQFDLSISQQIKSFIEKHPGFKYIAYYQAHTNTCAPVDELRKKYEIIFDFKDIVGLFIGTRPDAISLHVYPLLEELNKKTYLTVELGLQSIHAQSLEFLNRNHTYGQFLDTFAELRKRSIDVVVHLIVGIPGESPADMLQTVKEMNRIKPAGVKLHLMHVLKNTPLFHMYEKETFKLLEKDEYVDLIVYLLEHLDPGIVIHRLTGERDKEIFHAPLWALDKNEVIQSIRSKMIQKNTFQGKLLNNQPGDKGIEAG